jgi:hypothetical protein
MSNIQPGDLVMVMHHPCTCEDKGRDPHGGWVVTAGVLGMGWHCNRCGHFTLSDPVFRLDSADGVFFRPPRCLKKIPPFGALDGEPSQEKLVEPLKADAKRRHAEQDRPKERMQ